MEIPTSFEVFKTRGMKASNDIKNAWNTRDYKWLAVFLFYVLACVVVGLIIIFSSIITGLEKFGVLRDNINAPKTQLTYESKDEAKEIDGKYTQVFILKFALPMGQNSGKLLFNVPVGCDSKNMAIIPDTRGSNFKNGTVYAESSYEIICTTNTPIIDNLELFTPKN